MPTAPKQYPRFIPGSYEDEFPHLRAARPQVQETVTTVTLCKLKDLPKYLVDAGLFAAPPSRSTITRLRLLGLITFVTIPGCRRQVDARATIRKIKKSINQQ